MGRFKTILIARHGQTDWNIIGKTQGQTDIPLNETGKIQAAALANMLKKHPIEEIHSSDLSRARETAEIVAPKRGLPVTINSHFKERNFGKFEGKLWQQYMDELHIRGDTFRLLNEKEKRDYKLHPDMESSTEAITRVEKALFEIATQTPATCLLIVTHGFIMLDLLQYFNYGTHAELPPTCIANTALLTLSFNKNQLKLLKVTGVKKVVKKVVR